ncbi:MAG: hypothetical protein IJU61_06735 [Victivallales bacterium]|nr:hypothetical protein [Victivallales bacterium]
MKRVVCLALFCMVSCGVVWIIVDIWPLGALWTSERRWTLAHWISEFADANGRVPFDGTELNLWLHGMPAVEIPDRMRFDAHASVDEIIDSGKRPVSWDGQAEWINSQIQSQLTRYRRDGFAPMVGKTEGSIYEHLLQAGQGQYGTAYGSVKEKIDAINLFLKCKPLPPDYMEKMREVFLCDSLPAELRFTALRNLGVAYLQCLSADDMGKANGHVGRDLLFAVAKERKSPFAGIALYGTVRILRKSGTMKKEQLADMLASYVKDESAHKDLRLAAIFLSGELGDSVLKPVLADLLGGQDDVLAVSAGNVIGSCLDSTEASPAE